MSNLEDVINRAILISPKTGHFLSMKTDLGTNDDDPYIGVWVHPENDAPLEMVGRKGSHDMAFVANYICDLLDIQSDEEVLDLCCGNGLVTKLVAEHCKSVCGVDYSPSLLGQAEKISVAKNISYIRGDATKLSDALGEREFDKIYISAAFQYFNKQTGSEVISNLYKHSKKGASIAILDIPDQSKKLGHQLRSVKRLLLPNSDGQSHKDNVRFHSTWARLKYLARNVVMRIKPSKDGAVDELGWWWKRSEFMAIAESGGFSCEIKNQPAENPHHLYRFDAFMTRR